MSNEGEKMIKAIKQLIEAKGLKTEKEIKDFFENNFNAKDIDDIDFDQNVTEEDYLIDLISKAREEEDSYEAILFIEDALEIDKKSIDAYAVLATKVEHPFLTEYFLKKAVKLGKKEFSKEFLEENKEHLWTILEIRPYLKAHAQLAHYYFSQGYVFESSKILSHLINICPNDNMGNRELLFTQLLALKKFKKFKKYLAMFEDDDMASSLFSKVYYSYFKDNDLEKTSYLLKSAQQANKNIVKKLINPNIKVQLAGSFMLGSVEEANNYCFFAREMWQQDAELIHWLKQNQ